MDAIPDRRLSDNSSPSSSRRLPQGVWLLLVGSLCIANVLLIKQNRELRAAVASGQPEFLEPGQEVTPFVAHTVSGRRHAVSFANHAKTVLLIFQPRCPACERTAPDWREIRAACARNRYQIVAIGLGDVTKSDEFLTSHGLDLEALVDVGADVRRTYKLNVTPITIVVNSSGVVERVWPGTFNAESKADAERYFGISLTNNAN